MTGLALAGAHHARFGRDGDATLMPQLVDYWAERLDPYGAPVEPDRYLAGNRNSFAGMSMHVVDQHRPAGPLDLMIAAHATPDCDPFVSLAGSYARRYDDGALVFAVSDQGRLAPFSALRLVRAFPGRQRALVIVLDQSSGIDPGLADLDNVADHAVGLLLAADAATRLQLLPELTEVPPERVATAVEAALGDRAVDRAIDLVIAGPRVGPLPGVAAPVRAAPPDQLCTAVWSALADELTAPARQPRRIAVVDYEPDLGCLCLAVLDAPARP